MKWWVLICIVVVALLCAIPFAHRGQDKLPADSAQRPVAAARQGEPLSRVANAERASTKKSVRAFDDARVQAAWKDYSGESNPLRKEDKTRAFIEGLAFSDIASVLAAIAKDANSDEFAAAIGIRLIRRWAEIDPRAAALWAERLQVGGFRKDALSAVGIMWANIDIGQAADWAMQLSEPEEKSAAVKSVAYEAARTDPLTALDLVEELDAGGERDELTRHAALQWAATDPEAAAEWGTQIEDKALRAKILSGVAVAWAEKDPVAAAQLAALSLPPGRAQDDAVVSIVERWVQKDPKKTVTWVELFPEGKLKKVAVENAVRIWAEQDSESAADWLEGIKDSTFYDSAAGEFTTWLKVWSPEAASKWEETLSAEYRRRNKVNEMESSLHENSPSFQPWTMAP